MSVARQATLKRREALGTAVANTRNLMDGVIQRVANDNSLKVSTLPGSKVKAHKLMTPELRRRYENLTDEERAELLDGLTDYRTSNETGHYITEKSDHHAALAKLGQIDRLLESLEHQHDIQFLFVAVRGSMQSYFKPHVSITGGAQTFWNMSNQENVERWTQRLEGLCVGGIEELLAKDKLSNSDLLVKIRDKLTQKLVEITNDPKVKMVYARFEQDITNKYGVILEGWPFLPLRNLSDERPSNSKLSQLYQSLLDNKCYFRKLTSDELETREANCERSTTGGKGPKQTKQRQTTHLVNNTSLNTLAPQVPPTMGL
ncbi:hypothetical protein RhiJN_10832 [Ceratobasidium sp. AG-Ba]|nr:hypothetical protein RhiJN_03853 [Ceratobasidium sp. AG-Ba]QRV82817.1 hypothetical protein RhiJN_10832 [Ceratobasidium sp. AG-Ba]